MALIDDCDLCQRQTLRSADRLLTAHHLFALFLSAALSALETERIYQQQMRTADASGESRLGAAEPSTVVCG